MKHKNKKVSIIVPTFNREKHLDTALRSVFNQTFVDFEVIVVDDGSTDGTEAVVEQYQGFYPEKVRYFYQSNRGPGSARNLGIQKAVGEYIAFLDSDDVWDSRKLGHQVSFLEENPDIGGVFSDYYAFDKKENVVVKSYFQSICLFDQLKHVERKDNYCLSKNMLSLYVFKNFVRGTR